MFAVSVLLQTILGLYSVGPTFDIANSNWVCVALGATPKRIRRLVMRQGLRLITGGAVVGIVGAMLAGIWLSSVVPGTSPPDGRAIVAAIIAVCLVATAALAIPAQRAARTKPADVLRRS